MSRTVDGPFLVITRVTDGGLTGKIRRWNPSNRFEKYEFKLKFHQKIS